VNSTAEAAVTLVHDDPGDFTACMRAAHAICRIRERIPTGKHWREPTADEIITRYVNIRYSSPVERKEKWHCLVAAASKIAEKYSTP
jgi:hypothetical protein